MFCEYNYCGVQQEHFFKQKNWFVGGLSFTKYLL